MLGPPCCPADAIRSIPQSARKHHILSTEAFAALAVAQIRQCASDAFILVSQPGLHVEDLATRARPVQAGVHLKELLAGVPAERQWLAENVYVHGVNANANANGGEAVVDMGVVVERLQEAAMRDCGAVLKGVDAKSLSFPSHSVKATGDADRALVQRGAWRSPLTRRRSLRCSASTLTRCRRTRPGAKRWWRCTTPSCTRS